MFELPISAYSIHRQGESGSAGVSVAFGRVVYTSEAVSVMGELDDMFNPGIEALFDTVLEESIPVQLCEAEGSGMNMFTAIAVAENEGWGILVCASC